MSVEGLERRCLMSVSYDGTLLRVTGTSGDDTISLSYEGTGGFGVFLKVRENGRLTNFGIPPRYFLIQGGEGDDRITIGHGLPRVTLDGGAGDDTLSGGEGSDVLYGRAGDDEIRGGAGKDYISGFKGDDSLYGEAGADTLLGEQDDDDLDGGTDADDMSGGAGEDWALYWDRTTGVMVSLDDLANDGSYLAGSLVSTEFDNARSDIENVIGGVGNDRLSSPWSKAVNNRFSGENGNDYIEAGAGDDYIEASGGDDTVYGQDGNDTLHGSFGRDLLNGGQSDDSLTGGSGEDSLYGEGGHDTLRGDANADLLSGGGGLVDVVDYSSRTTNLQITLDGVADDGAYHVPFLVPISLEFDNVLPDVENVIGGSGNDRIWSSSAMNINNVFWGNGGRDGLSGGGGIDSLMGGDEDDHLDGSSGNDVLRGEEGNDSLFGDLGDDLLFGGRGNDTLAGSAGTDTLLGEEGADFLHDRDGIADFLFGGEDEDTAEFETADLRSSIETLIQY
jgi:Ca2+-binding RTX toxin-like protein